MEPIIVHHDNCHDGITALWCAKKRWPNAEAYAGKYSEPPDLERLRDRDVVVVDFSWKRPAMLELAKVAKSILVLDHHQTAAAELDGLAFAKFDLSRSGAGMAWDEFFPNTPRPSLVDYVEDRDLWRFSLPCSREVHAACASYPLTLEVRDELMGRKIEDLIGEGEAILRYHDKLVASAAQNAGRMVIGGHDVPAIACPNIELASDLGHALAKGQPFAAVYVDKPDGGRYVGLRSTPEGLDVSEIARSFGGGGHRNAAGFTTKAEACHG